MATEMTAELVATLIETLAANDLLNAVAPAVEEERNGMIAFAGRDLTPLASAPDRQTILLEYGDGTMFELTIRRTY